MTATPVFVEEKAQMSRPAVKDPVREQEYEISELSFQFFILPYPVKGGVRLPDMQVCIR